MISEATIDKVRELSIVDVVSKFVELKKSGPSWRAHSPFSKGERTPSFYVVPAKGIFKCFSTGKGGDGIAFVMSHENLSYIDAIKYLCTEFRIPIEYDNANGYSKEHYEEIEALYLVNQLAARRYAKELLETSADHPAYIELINKRRFTADTIAQWQIGFAPGGTESYSPEKWNFLASRLIAKGFYQQGTELGLIKTKGQTNYDAFRNRITFPIIDHRGRYVGFGARALKPDEYNAKYLNSPETRIFNKSKLLFGLHFASNEIRKVGFANLMEGYTDVISFHQAGHINTVGTCGTALTVEQARLLKKYTDKVVLIYDPDKAGQSAAMRSILLLTGEGFQCSVVPLPAIIDVDNNRESAFITAREADSITIKTDEVKARQIPLSQVKEIVKIDPDELVRMF